MLKVTKAGMYKEESGSRTTTAEMVGKKTEINEYDQLNL